MGTPAFWAACSIAMTTIGRGASSRKCKNVDSAAANTLKERLPGVVRGMLDGRSNAYVEAMNGLLQQTKRAARGFRTVTNFIAIAYLRMAKLKHLPTNPLLAAMPLAKGVIRHAA